MKRASLHSIVTYTMIMMVMLVAPLFGQQRGSYILKNFTLSDFGDGYDAAQSLVWKPTYSDYVVQAPKEEGDNAQGDAAAADNANADQANTDNANADAEQKDGQAEKLGNDPDPARTGVSYRKGVPLGITDLVAGPQQYVLGVKGAFTRMGYNWIELRPYKLAATNEENADNANAADGQQADAQQADAQQADGQATTEENSEFAAAQPPVSKGKVENPPDPNAEAEYYPIPFFGIVDQVTLWVWGGNYKWWVEMYISDYIGYQYRFPLGDLMYKGWRQKRTAIPASIPQVTKRLPAEKGLKFEMIKLWSFPSENVTQFYAYFDLLQYESTISSEVFNGVELEKQLW